MNYIGFLTGALALLCLVEIVLSVVKHKLSKKEDHKSSDVKGVFFAIGFLPMVLMTLSSFRLHSPILTQFFAYIRNPFLSVEFTLDAFAGLGEFSFIMDFFTAILFGSTVAITLSGGLSARCVTDRISVGSERKDVLYGVKDSEPREVSASYLTFCRYLS